MKTAKGLVSFDWGSAPGQVGAGVLSSLSHLILMATLGGGAPSIRDGTWRLREVE